MKRIVIFIILSFLIVPFALYAQSASQSEGTILVAFSVSDSAKVYFSQGNLQYRATTNKWRFAKNQYDIIGRKNSNISLSYKGWVDLFGWGTSGYNGKNPYMTSTSFSDYGDGSNDMAGTNYDWGVYNAIHNGGNSTEMWRTLTYEEWSYVLFNRTDANVLKGSATVNGVTGMILLPDDWSIPVGLTFNNGFTKEFDNNIYNAGEWSKMKANGAVFLPTAGGRNGSDVYYVGSYGEYWSASAKGDDEAYLFYFDDGGAFASFGARFVGRSVRLVQDIK